jgi:diacylglycerol kinase family enzyme
MNDGFFELIILKKSWLTGFRQKLYRKYAQDTDDVLIISRIRLLCRTNNPVNFQIDGEYHGTESRLRFCSHKKLVVP